MDQSNPSARSETDADADAPEVVPERGREYLSDLPSFLRDGVESGAIPAIVGGTSLVGGIRAFLDGDRDRGLVGVAVGAVLLAFALRRRRSRGLESDSTVDEETDSASADGADAASVDRREVVTSGVEDAALEAGTVDEPDAAGGAADERAAPTSEMENTERRGVDDSKAAALDRLGAAAFDRQSREVPVPQRAFNQGFLAHSAEAFWGIRTSDDAVLVSLDYDAIEDREGVTFVTSSEIGADVRELPIPDAILDHWDDVIRGGTALAGGDDVLFATTDDLAADGLLRVLPADWADESA